MALVASITGFMVSSSGPGPLLAASSLILGRTASGQYGDGMKLKRDYLRLTGYRLPMEAEWEYACRAQTVTSRYYGESEALLREYGWYQTNAADRSWPVGRKKPNDLGLFDMHGNVWSWCQEEFKNYSKDQGGKLLEDKESGLLISDKSSRVLRGGSFVNQASLVRSANRFVNLPTLQSHYGVGFRPSRTLSPTAEGGRK
jgi:formylglycine-generating enzyme required for sulfatase activity